MLYTFCRGDATEPEIEEYRVGPLPQPMTCDKIIHSNWRKPIPYSLRSPTADGDIVPWKEFISRELAKVKTVLQQVTGCSYSLDCKDRCLTHMVVLPGHLTKSVRSMWISVYRKIHGLPLHPIGFQFRVNLLSTNSCNWNVDFVLFRNQTFNNMEHLNSSFTNTEGKAAPTKHDCRSLLPKVGKEDTPFSFSTESIEELQQRGPQSYMPDGRRFSVVGRNVDWLGWSFHFNMRSTTGIQLHDVRFNDQRIVYELSLQEIVTLYSGASDSSLSSVSMESLHLMGTLSPVLSPGIDCPEDASYFDFIHYMHFQPKLYQNSACLFEMNKGVPLKRHHQRNMQINYSHHLPPAVGLPDDVLVLRTIVVTDWHEYVFNFVFHQNGALEVTASITGTFQSRFDDNGFEFDRFGFQQFSSDAVYSNNRHFINFKVDLDINGHENRFETLNIGITSDNNIPKEIEQSDKTIYARLFSRNVVKNEELAVYDFEIVQPKYLLFYHTNASNCFGIPRAYRLVPMSIQSLKTENQLMDRSMAWTKHQVVVTKHKDDEDTSSTIYNAMDMLNPILNFQNYRDDESIVDEDLTAWVTLESLYIPDTEPGPTVEMLGNQPSFILQPFNYFDTEPSPSPPAGTERTSSNKELLMKKQISPTMPIDFVCQPVLIKNSASFCQFSICLALVANIWLSAAMQRS